MFFLNVISFPSSYFSFLFSHIHVSKKKINRMAEMIRNMKKKKLDGHYDNY